MIQSMTGYGKAELNNAICNIKIELRSLNSKFFDLNLRLPAALREKEYEVRNIANEKIMRGKVDLTITVEWVGGGSNFTINRALVKTFYQEIKNISAELNESHANTLDTVLKLPDVLVSNANNDIEPVWNNTLKTLQEAIQNFIAFRTQEGKMLEKEFEKMIEKIRQLVANVITLEPERLNNIKERINAGLNDSGLKEKTDSNRFEQELIYYIERMDFTEERVRLLNHCDYFLKTMRHENQCGRKLGFIAQEIGREINTLGSKANHAGIQQQVVMMKDELEKIKEQLMNVL